MIKHRKQTDNDCVHQKVALRKKAIAALSSVRVLDLFAGKNEIWSHISTERYLGVEKIKGKGKNLHVDNVRLIKSLDLSKFNVIDCDSYGIPANQISELFRNKTILPGTIIIYTMCTNRISTMPKTLVHVSRLQHMQKKCPTLLNKLTAELFYAFLYSLGVKKVVKYTKKSTFLKEYGYFTVDNV